MKNFPKTKSNMSTGQDCYFEEIKPNEWYLFLEGEPGAFIMPPEYESYGPFKTFTQADKYLTNNFANPGGFAVYPHEDSKDRTWECP